MNCFRTNNKAESQNSTQSAITKFMSSRSITDPIRRSSISCKV